MTPAERRRRVVLVVLVVAIVVVLLAQAAHAATATWIDHGVEVSYTIGPRSSAGSAFRVIDPNVNWPCADQAVFVDRDGKNQALTWPVDEALRQVREATGYAWQETTDRSAAAVVIRWSDHMDPGVGAYTTGQQGVHVEIVLYSGSEWWDGVTPALHELGHMVGLDHFPSPIMGGTFGSLYHYSSGEILGLAWLSHRRCA